jgi:hypothetical protein
MKIASRIILFTSIINFCSMCSSGIDKINNNTNGMINTKSLIINSNYKDIYIAQGEKYQLHVYDDTGSDISNKIIWISNNSNIVSVDNNGVVQTKLSEGSTDVYARYNDLVSNHITVTSGRIIFATRLLYDGNLLAAAQVKNKNITDAISAADYLCNEDPNKPEFGTFKALINDNNKSNNIESVIDTSKQVNYINRDGSIIGNSSPSIPIVFLNKFIDNNIDTSSNIANWSGADNQENCDNWTNNTNKTGSGGYGNGANSWYDDNDNIMVRTSIWSHFSKIPCNTKHPLICVEQYNNE